MVDPASCEVLLSSFGALPKTILERGRNVRRGVVPPGSVTVSGCELLISRDGRIGEDGKAGEDPRGGCRRLLKRNRGDEAPRGGEEASKGDEDRVDCFWSLNRILDGSCSLEEEGTTESRATMSSAVKVGTAGVRRESPAFFVGVGPLTVLSSLNLSLEGRSITDCSEGEDAGQGSGSSLLGRAGVLLLGDMLTTWVLSHSAIILCRLRNPR